MFFSLQIIFFFISGGNSTSQKHNYSIIKILNKNSILSFSVHCCILMNQFILKNFEDVISSTYHKVNLSSFAFYAVMVYFIPLKINVFENTYECYWHLLTYFKRKHKISCLEIIIYIPSLFFINFSVVLKAIQESLSKLFENIKYI